MARRFILDAGSVSRQVRKRYIVDAGGVARFIKKRWVIDAGGVARLTFLGEADLSMTAGTSAGSVGYFNIPPTTFGSLSPTTLPDGRTVKKLVDTSGVRLLEISGFSADPGAAYLSQLTANGTTLNGSAASYSYTSGTSDWQWSGVSPAFVNGVTYPVVIIL